MIAKRSVFAGLLLLSWLAIMSAFMRQETFAAGSRENLAWLMLLWLTICALLTVSLSLRWHQESPRNRASRTIAVLSGMNLLTFVHIYLVLGLTNWLVGHTSHFLTPLINTILGLLTLAVGAFAPVALICDLYLLTFRPPARQ